MKNFLTGSRCYGTPREDSDTDMVIDIDESRESDVVLFAALRDHAESIKEYTENSACFRFGKLNLIVTRCDEQYNAWYNGTAECIRMAPVTRDQAIEIMKANGVT